MTLGHHFYAPILRNFTHIPHPKLITAMAKLSDLIVNVLPQDAKSKYIEVKRFYDRHKLFNPTLFGGHDKEFQDAMQNCKIYGEYGCGQSTVWVALNTSCIILSVDSSQEWVKNVQGAVADTDRVSGLEWINLGEIGKLGRPKSYANRSNIDLYLNSIWGKSEGKPDTVLVDGRFRVACFLTSLLKAEIGSTIIFDDYYNRPVYHIVEEYIKPTLSCGRQALFIKTTPAPTEKLLAEINRFRYVMD